MIQPSAGVVFQPSNAPTAPQVIGHPGPDMPYYPQQPTGYPLHPPEYVNNGASLPPAQVDKPMMRYVNKKELAKNISTKETYTLIKK